VKTVTKATPSPRVPPGQYVTQTWPVLSYGPTPRFDPTTWDFRVFGEVEEPRHFTYAEFRALPQSLLSADFHCVSGWSRLDNRWGGVLAKDIHSLVSRRPQGNFVLIHCDSGYTTNLTLEEFIDSNVIFAHRHDNAELEPEHGWPLRLVVPKLYAWKSAKWVRAVEFTRESRRGFWELRGYHRHGDPWGEERYSDQE
jgi:DMSO/TMAO reductase YedYZ molybdopterin-dependent catalytic subunit